MDRQVPIGKDADSLSGGALAATARVAPLVIAVVVMAADACSRQRRSIVHRRALFSVKDGAWVELGHIPPLLIARSTVQTCQLHSRG